MWGGDGGGGSVDNAVTAELGVGLGWLWRGGGSGRGGGREVGMVRVEGMWWSGGAGSGGVGEGMQINGDP